MNRRTLLVATPGGHVDELLDLEGRFTLPGTEPCWVTARSPQTQTLLHDRVVEWVPPVGTRQWARALLSLPRALAVVRRLRPSRLVSSGAALAVPYMLAGRAMGTEVIYLESATRLTGPSLTGRLVERIPGVTLYRQDDWQRGRWQRTRGVFDHYTVTELDRAPTVANVLVTLGSERFPFQRALDAVATLPGSVRLALQTGTTPAPPEGGAGLRPWWPYAELASATDVADAVITHGGVGAMLLAMRSGHRPVVIPREARHGEHIDDHQVHLAKELAARGLIVLADPSRDLWAQVQEAARWTVVRGP